MKKILVALSLALVILVSCGSTNIDKESPWITNSDGIGYRHTEIEGMDCIYLQWGQSITCDWGN